MASIKLPLNLLLIMIFGLSNVANANMTCKGKFTNPITDICWSCVLPISIGGLSVGKGLVPSKRDISNPSSPLCLCTKGGIPTPGITLGFWEPVRMVDIARAPYCMVGLGGLQLGPNNMSRQGSYNRSYGNRESHDSFYHLHYYVYPLIYWLELITDLACLEQSTFDVAYLSELDPTWGDEKLQSLLNPESFLFASPMAQAACAIDCASATLDIASDKLFWCTGCYGNLYPWGGTNADHAGGVQNGSLLTARILAKMHRTSFAKSTSTNNASPNGAICRKETCLTLKKSQYKLQMVYPRASRGSIGCWPLGMSDTIYSPGNEYPWDGQDWSYIIWRKRNCCVF